MKIALMVQICENGTSIQNKCTEWMFDNTTFTHTITSEFGLVCEKEYLRATYQSMYMLGVLVGSPINGLVADRHGRKKVFVTGAALFAVMAIVSSWMPNVSSILAFRFLLGTMHPTLLKTGYILAVEITDPKLRSVVGVIFFLPWALGTMAWGGLAYLVRSWRWLQLCASLPCLLIIPALWFVDESPRWLSVRGQHGRALEVIKRAARWNKTVIPSDDELMLIFKESQDKVKVAEEKKVEKEHSLKVMFMDFIKTAFILYRTPRLCFVSAIMHLDFFVFGMVYFGLALSGSNFKSDAFVYMVLMGLMEVPGCTFMGGLISRFGRRIPICLSLLLTGLVLLVLPFLPSEIQWLVVTFAMVGKMTITMAFQAGNLFGSELFPTEVRTRGLSTSFMLSRVGSSISPFITEYLGVAYPWAPSVIFGASAIVAGIATLTVWETIDMALPDTVAQMESKDFKVPKRLTFKVGPREKLGITEAVSKEESLPLKSKTEHL
ncbi:organic cation transporter protein-like isoform X2 [Palaemon carinicauda]|uniref:organic cation transporter protein-like isoform X2 n=1 Tax=Palaemon carinicauda TaxID=392227 RepID=UPI0035B5EF75